MTAEHALSPEDDDAMVIDDLVARARAAQALFEQGADQARYDRAALAAGWALMEPQRNRELSEMAVETTGLGNVADKITKNHRKTLGLLRDIKHARTQGIIKEDAERGITEIARPAGVVAAVAPSTNPVATPTNNIVNALKCGNAIIVAPSPKGADVCARLIGYIHAEFDKAGIDRDLVQMVPSPASKAKTQRLMERADLLIVTGSQDNVRRAYTSGTPALGVGTGNVTVIVDETADLTGGGGKDRRIEMFRQRYLVLVGKRVGDRRCGLRSGSWRSSIRRAGGCCEGDQAEKLKSALFQDGKLNRAIIARDIDQVIAAADVGAEGARFLAGLRRVGSAPIIPNPARSSRWSPQSTGRRTSPRPRIHRRPPPAPPRCRAFHRPALRGERARRRTWPRLADLPGGRQPGPLLRHRRRIRQRHAVLLVHGLRHLGRQCARRQSESPAFHEHHQDHPHDPGE